MSFSDRIRKVKTSPYQIQVSNELALFLRSLHPELKRKIKAALRIILSSPENGKALRDELAGLRSFRVSRFRIIYKVSGRTIELVAVGPRERIYLETYRIIKKGLS
jgi:mRNA interferase RelE/StbE